MYIVKRTEVEGIIDEITIDITVEEFKELGISAKELFLYGDSSENTSYTETSEDGTKNYYLLINKIQDSVASDIVKSSTALNKAMISRYVNTDDGNNKR